MRGEGVTLSWVQRDGRASDCHYRPHWFRKAEHMTAVSALEKKNGNNKTLKVLFPDMEVGQMWVQECEVNFLNSHHVK